MKRPAVLDLELSRSHLKLRLTLVDHRLTPDYCVVNLELVRLLLEHVGTFRDLLKST